MQSDPPADARARARRLSQAFADLCDIHGFELEITGSIPKGPAVIVANHLSYLDPAVILATAAAVPICKQSVGEWPLIGDGAKALGVLLVDRENIHRRAVVLRKALRALAAGIPVVNFPEGTTTDGSTLLPFYRGIFGVAQIAGAPVVPVALRFDTPEMTWTGTQTFLPHYLKTAARAKTRVFLDFLEPIPSRMFVSADALSTRARNLIALRLRKACHESTERIRLPEPRTDAVLPAATS
jgi:1-acyl-sn-glycerol-3-phosphate acyltransferase